MRRFIYCLLVAAAVCNYGAANGWAEPNDEQTIKKGDLLRVSVAGHDNLTMNAIVDDNGKISFPLINEVYAIGKMPGELAIEIEERLSEFIRYPKATVSYRNTFFVYGEVYRPGEFELQGRIDVLKAITIAGGFTDFASHKVKIIKSSSKRKDLWVNVDNIIKGQGEDGDILVGPRDIIVVSDKPF